MKWNIYIARRVRPGEYESDKHTLEVPKTSRGDNAYVTVYAAKHFRVSQDKVLVMPTPQGELRDSRRRSRRRSTRRRR